MSVPGRPDPAKLVIGVLMRQKEGIAPLAAELVQRFGPIDTVSRWLPFDHTRYYAGEMGEPLHRRVFSFAELIAQEALPAVKLATNALEEELSAHGRRTANIDPGYLLRERFVLATGKNFAHRIHVGEGIYADLTLIREGGRYVPLPWTYADYAEEEMVAYLASVREKYVVDLENSPGKGAFDIESR